MSILLQLSEDDLDLILRSLRYYGQSAGPAANGFCGRPLGPVKSHPGPARTRRHTGPFHR